MNDFERIYRDWHEYAKNRDTDALIALYADDAVFESPLVPAIMIPTAASCAARPKSCVFTGRYAPPSNDLVRWYRDGRYFVAGDTLVWEYPRQTPDGDQVDILEVMRLEGGKSSTTAFIGAGSARRC